MTPLRRDLTLAPKLGGGPCGPPSPLGAGARTFLRIAIAVLLLATATGKLLDLRGFASVLEAYRAFPRPLLVPIAAAVPLAELVLAAWLVSGRRLKGAALASAALHASYAVWAGLTLARGIELPNCGCFGVFLARPLTWGTVLEDGVMVTASLVLALLARRRSSAAAGAALVFAAAAVIPADLDFRDWFTDRGVAVEMSRSGQATPWVRGTGEVSAPPGLVAAVLTDFPRYREIFAPAVKSARILDRGEGIARLHVVWPYPFPFRNRDAVIAYTWDALPGGGLLLSWRDATRSGDPREGVRIQRVAGQTRVEPLEGGGSRVTYTYLGDLGGKFPRSAEEKAWRAEPVEYFRALRRALGVPDRIR